MIKRLKRRFVFVNMSILTFVLISILISVFALMYSSEVRLSYEIMESLLSQKDMENDKNDMIVDENIVLNVMPMNNNYNEDMNIPFENNKDNWNNWENKEDNNWYNETPVFTKKNEEIKQPNFTEPQKFEEKPFPTEEHIITKPIYPSENEKPVSTTALSSPIQTKKETTKSKETKQSENNNPIVSSEKHEEKPKKDTEKTPNTLPSEKPQKENVIKDTYTNPTIENDTSITTHTKISKPPVKPNDEFIKKTEPDPFRGKVKRSYMYVEFNDTADIEQAVYQYYTSENDGEVKKAVNQICDDNDEKGKISIGKNKYRYMLRYNPIKDSYSVVMLDRTLEINTINRLLVIFVIIAGIGLFLISIISILLANWTIKPVANAWTQQKEFIANASHELKTPLTVISTNTDVILSNPADTVENQAKWLNYIKNETVRMSKLVNNLLCIAKYDANRIETIYGKVNLSDLVSGICLQYEPLAFENHKTLITEIDNDIQMLGDEDKLKQVVNILMDNALKYSLEKGTIKITLKKVKQSICMTVSNSSENISAEHLEKIFDRFYRVDTSRNRKTGGSGLGLNIAKNIVENHKGTINVINKDNITSFIVTF